MDISHITSQSLLHLLSLAEKKDALVKAIEEVNAEIANTIRGGATSVIEALEVVKVVKKSQPQIDAPAKSNTKTKPAPAVRKVKVGRSGGLKDRILALLEEAGPLGLQVKDISDKLGVKGTNISVWFSTTGKGLTKRLSPGRYAAKGAKSPAPAAIPAAAPAKPAKGAKKSQMSPEGRARIGAAAKARWAARRANKTSPKPAAPAKAPVKKGFQQSKYN